jgi:NADH dehydrogenase
LFTKIEKVCVLGGSGFVGSHIVHRLSAAGYQVKVLTRRREEAKHLILLPGVQVEECDVFFEAALQRALQGCDAVINLIGILHESRRHSFDKIHAELPRRVAAACAAAGVTRLLHMSALHASPDAPSAYLRSKAAGESAVLQAGKEGLRVTVFRPSVIFGRGDSFLNLFAALARWMPVMVLASPNARFQPIYVEDVAQAFVASLQDARTFGQSYDLCGPRVYTLRELVAYVAATLGLKRPVIGLGDKLSYLQAWAMEALPVKLMTRDNYYSMKVDSVSAEPFPALFDIAPVPMEAVVPEYLANDTPRQAYLQFRSMAGRTR